MFVEPGAAADNQTLAGAQPAFLNFDIALLDEPAGGSMQARSANVSMYTLRLTVFVLCSGAVHAYRSAHA